VSDLKRALSLSGLLLYGIVLIQPTAPMPLFGAVAEKAQGHVVTAVLFGMVAMLFTAISYGRMASAHPSAGSAYTYAKEELHPAAGYVVGWGMIFDYAMNPIICAIWCSKAAMNLVPGLPFAACAVFFAVFFTLLNLRGIEASTRTNAFIAACLGVVIVLFLAAAARHLWLQPPAGAAAWTRPFYDPATFSLGSVSTGASLAVLTYIGFDGISTLAEETHDPRRNILRATILVCVVTGVLASIQVYTAQLVWPASTFPDADTAFVHVAGQAGGPWLFHTINFALLVATVGSGTGAMLGAARLLYGMGRTHALPPGFFAAVHPRTRVPHRNVLLLGACTIVGALTVSFSLGAELLNFGALIAFMGVNAACFARFFLRAERKSLGSFLPPVLGFGVCFYLWLSLGGTAKLVGFTWLAAGVIYGLWRMRRLRAAT
jgi:amino acid transporter